MNIIRLQSYHLKQWTRKIKTSTWSIVYLVCVFVCSLQRQSNNVQFLLRTMFFLFLICYQWWYRWIRTSRFLQSRFHYYCCFFLALLLCLSLSLPLSLCLCPSLTLFRPHHHTRITIKMDAQKCCCQRKLITRW